MNHARTGPPLSAQANFARSAKLRGSHKRGFAPLPAERENLLNL